MQTMGETKETNREDTTRQGDNTSMYLDMQTAGQKDEQTHSTDRLSSKQAQEDGQIDTQWDEQVGT